MTYLKFLPYKKYLPVPFCDLGSHEIFGFQTFVKRVNLSKQPDMEEIIFMVEESPEGGFIAKGLGVSIYTQAESIPALKEAVIDAVSCHFDDDKKGY